MRWERIDRGFMRRDEREAVWEVTNVDGRRGRPKKICLNTVENDIRAGGVHGMCKFAINGVLGQGWPTPNSWEIVEGEKKKKKTIVAYRSVVIVGHSMLLVFPAGRLLLGVLTPEKAVGSLQQRHVLLLHRAVCSLELGPLVRHHARRRHLRPSRIPARCRHTVVNPFPWLTEKLLFFPAQYAHPYHLHEKYTALCNYYFVVLARQVENCVK